MNPTFKILFPLSALLIGCSNPVPNPNKESKNHNDSISTLVKNNDTSENDLLGSGDYLSDYHSEINFDTTICCNGNSIRIFQYTDTNKRVSLPHELVDNSKHQQLYETCIKIYSIKKPVKAIQINRTQFKEYLSSDTSMS